MGVALNALQKDQNQLEVQYQKESEDRKKLEQELDNVKKNLESTKGQLAHTEKVNLVLYKRIQGLE